MQRLDDNDIKQLSDFFGGAQLESNDGFAVLLIDGARLRLWQFDHQGPEFCVSINNLANERMAWGEGETALDAAQDAADKYRLKLEQKRADAMAVVDMVSARLSALPARREVSS